MALLDIDGNVVPETAVKELRNALHGALLEPGDTCYHDARKVWNGMIDRHPGLIARCASADDVIRAVNFGRDHDLLIAVRGGGHNMAGLSVCDNGLMIDLAPMKGITVNPATQRAVAQPGVVWGEFDQATQEHGLAVTGGMITHTGIAGLTLGSGFGWLMRNFALTHDNLLSLDLVTADGASRRVNADEHPDLFWALRGGGGNFGIVTSFEYRLHQLGPVLGGMVLYPLAEASAVIGGWQDIALGSPDELTTGVVLVTTPDGAPVVAVVPCWSGPDLGAGEAVAAPLHRLGTVAADLAGPMPYVAQQSLVDASFEPGWRYYQRAAFFDAVTDDFIAVAADAYSRAPSPLCGILVVGFGGAVGRVAPEAGAFPHRNSPFYTDVIAAWTDPADDDRCIAWLKDTWEAMLPLFPGDAGVDVNHVDRGEDRLRAAYRANYDRLAAIKRAYDPENLFRLNQNIKPAG